MSRPAASTDSRWARRLDRRDVLKLGAFLVSGGVAAVLVGACSPANRSGESSAAPTASGTAPTAGGSAPRSSGPILALIEGGDPQTQPVLKKVYDDFRAQNPGIEWDIRGIQGLGPDWDRLARAALASGEPVGLVMLDGLFVRAWARDGLLADLGADPLLADVLARVPDRFHLGGIGEATARVLPIALSGGVQTTGLYYNKALLDRAGVEPPTTIADLKAMVKPLATVGAAPLVHCAGDVSFNPMLVNWLLPMIAERTGDPLAFVESTVKGTVRYDSPEWVEALQIVADLRSSGVLLNGSGATDYATMQQLLLKGKAAMTYNGTWLLGALKAGTPTVAFDLHVAPLPRVDEASIPRSLLAWAGFAIPTGPAASRDSVDAFLEYASRPAVDAAVAEGLQSLSPIAASNVGIHDPLEREFLPLFDDAITSLNWLWEPEIDTEIGNQVQALVKGDAEPAAAAQAVQAVADQLRASGRSYYP